MKLTRLGGLVLGLGIVATLFWVFFTPEVFVNANGARMACSRLGDSRCGPDSYGMAIRFVIGAGGSFFLAVAESAFSGQRPADNEEPD